MRQFVVAGFAEKFHPQHATAAQSISHGPRSGLCCNDTHVEVHALVDDARRYFSEAVWIVAGWEWRVSGGTKSRPDANLMVDPTPTHFANQCETLIKRWRKRGGADASLWIEIGNELDMSYWRKHLDQFFELAMECYERTRSLSKEVRFITGSTMNLNKSHSWQEDDGFAVLDDLCRFSWPADTLQGVHPYRGPGREWKSFDDDAHALRELTKILRGRQAAITEIGWSTSGGYTGEQVADFVRQEIHLWRDSGAACFCLYQLQDGPEPITDVYGGYGAYTNVADGFAAKPVAAVMREESS